MQDLTRIKEEFPGIIFPADYELLPGVDEVYELQLAYLESKMLSPEEIISNGAFFEGIGSNASRHFVMCTGQSLKLPNHSSSRLRHFLEKNIFKTGYGTHGLFPYRGKFHPQMVKALLNIMALKPGEIVLDPMMGSGTVCIEACLMGIHSIGIDASPFCRFMAETKVRALTMNLQRAQKAIGNADSVFSYFHEQYTGQEHGCSLVSPPALSRFLTSLSKIGEKHVLGDNALVSDEDRDLLETYSLLLLGYLDAVGYAERSKRKSAQGLFQGILERYLFVCEKIQKYLHEDARKLAEATVFSGDAREMVLADQYVDGILFSPPYSFAVDYIANDQFHLEALNVDIDELREKMVGLRGGKKLADKYYAYRKDMAIVLGECHRVLKPKRFCTVVIGTNSNQVSKALGISKERVQGLDELVRELGQNTGFEFIKQIDRPISGISNTMRREHIIMMRKG